MIRAVQTIGWSFLPPEPLMLEGPVCAFVGPNGSGKSGMLDALKLAMGCRRFGQGRTAFSYRFAGRAGAPAARTAYVLCVIANRSHDGSERLTGRPEELTIVVELTPSQRRFLVLDGRQLLDPADPDRELERLRAQHARSAWLKPSEYERRVLEPLGIGPAVRRMLELPQGDIQRALDRDPRALIGLLVELSGGRDAQDAFDTAEAAVTAAREALAETRRRHDRRRADLAEQQLCNERQRHDGELRNQLASLVADLEAALATLPAPTPAPADPPHPRVHPADTPRLPLIAPARLQAAGVRLVGHDGLWCVHPDSLPAAEHVLGPGETLPVATPALRGLREHGALVCGPPLPDRPALDPDTRAAATIEAPAGTIAHERTRRDVQAALNALHRAGIGRGHGRTPLPPAAELLGEFRALTRSGIPAQPDPAAQRKLRETAADLTADGQELERRETVLRDASDRLVQARATYEKAVWRALTHTSKRFTALCDDAGLAGRIVLEPGPAGANVTILAAEEPGEELRPLHGAQASLSGGWRATVVVLSLLAAVDGGQGLSLLLLDEVGASLDEQRLHALGCAFRSLGERRGLLTVMTVPSNTLSQTIGAFARQQVGFIRPLPSEPLAPPPHIVTARLRAAS